MTDNLRKCPQCSAELPPDAPEGLCPACLLQKGFATESSVTAEFETTSAEIERLFPDLEIEECLGRGGMGVVYKARQKQLDRVVALKVMKADTAKDPAFAERFTREARALARLDHANIVSVFDFGRREGRFFLLMEYVDGANLRQVIRSKALKSAEALEIVPEICQALQYAHDQGVVHRDIKPENILVDKAGKVKIADFGLAKIIGAGEQNYTLTQEGVTMGTVRYMAPEQMDNPQEVDHRADIYSLGVVFYEMLTGEVPMGRFAPPSRKVEVDVRLDEVVLRSLEREPEHRFQHVSEVRSEVESIVREPATSAPAAVAGRKLNGTALCAAGMGVVSMCSGIANKVMLDDGQPLSEMWFFMMITLLTGVAGSLCGISAGYEIRNSNEKEGGLRFAALGTLLFPLVLFGGILAWSVPGMRFPVLAFLTFSMGWIFWKPACNGTFEPSTLAEDDKTPGVSMKATLGLLLGCVGSVLVLVLALKVFREFNVNEDGMIPPRSDTLSLASLIFTAWVAGLGVASPWLGWRAIHDVRHSDGRLVGRGVALWSALLMPAVFALLISLSVAALAARFWIQAMAEPGAFGMRAISLLGIGCAAFAIWVAVRAARRVCSLPAGEPVGWSVRAMMFAYVWTVLLIAVLNLVLPVGEWVVLGLHALLRN